MKSAYYPAFYLLGLSAFGSVALCSKLAPSENEN